MLALLWGMGLYARDFVHPGGVIYAGGKNISCPLGRIHTCDVTDSNLLDDVGQISRLLGNFCTRHKGKKPQAHHMVEINQ